MPRGEAELSEHVGEWYFLISDREIGDGDDGVPGGGEGGIGGGAMAGALHGGLIHPSDLFDNGIAGGPVSFSPEPLGNDLFAQYGDQDALPIFGNFDPPVSDPAVAMFFTNQDLAADIDHNGIVAPRDALHVVSALNKRASLGVRAAQSTTLYLDANGDGDLTPRDALMVIDYLNHLAQGAASSAALTAPGDAPEAAAMSPATGSSPTSSASQAADETALGGLWDVDSAAAWSPLAARLGAAPPTGDSAGEATPADRLFDASLADESDWLTSDDSSSSDAQDQWLDDELEPLAADLAAQWEAT